MKRKIRALLALLLIPALMLSLAACGKQAGEEKGNDRDKDNPEEIADTGFVYASEYNSLKLDSASYMQPLYFTGEGYYASYSEKVGEEIPEGAVIEYEGQFDIFETRLYFLTLDGAAKPIAGYEPLPRVSNTEGYQNFWSGSGISGLTVDANGNLIAVENVYLNYYSGPEDAIYTENGQQYWFYSDEYYLRVLDQDGAEISRAKLDFNSNESWLNFGSMLADAEGNLLCVSDMQVLAFAPDGSLAYTVACDNYLNDLVALKDGTPAVVMDGERGLALCPLDAAKHSLSSEKYQLPGDSWNMFPGGGDYDLAYLSGQTLYGYKLETQEAERILNLMDCDINANFVSGVSMLSDGSVTALVNNYDESAYGECELVKLSQVPASSVPQKTELTLAVMNAEYNYQLSNMIIRFNRNSDTSRIKVLDYSQYNTDEDYSAGLTKLTTEVLSGSMPDILCLSGLPYEQLAAKGLLEDLYPYLDADSAFKREDFFPNVLSAMEVDGKLCMICPSFSITSLIGASSVVGDKPGWSYADFNAALASMPAGCEPLDPYTTRDDILRSLVALEMDELVDWSTGKCSFESEGFIELLKFAARFPKSFDWDNYDWTESDDEQVRIAEGRQMLRRASIYYINNLMYNEAYFSGDITYVGFPTSTGTGSMLSLGAGDGSCYAVSTSCKDKGEAWNFLRSFLTEKEQLNAWGLPVNRSAFNKLLEEAMTPEYRKDADGNIMVDANGEKLQVSKGQYGRADGSIVNIYAMTQEQADQLMELITTTTKVENYNDSIFDIVNEQAQAFFAGQKSAEEVARLIQSKANIYVNEQR